MGLRTYLKEKRSKAISQYHHLQGKAISKFHQWKQVDSSVEAHCFIDESEVKIEECKEVDQSKQESCLKEKPQESIDQVAKLAGENRKHPKITNDMRVIHITVKNGKILERIYLNDNGEKICISNQGEKA